MVHLSPIQPSYKIKIIIIIAVVVIVVLFFFVIIIDMCTCPV